MTDREGEHNPDVHVSDLLDDEGAEKLESGSGGPMANSTGLGWKMRAWAYGLAITAAWTLLSVSDSLRPPYVSAQFELGAAVVVVVVIRVVLGWSL